jgi:hypothetical protein
MIHFYVSNSPLQRGIKGDLGLSRKAFIPKYAEGVTDFLV